jgi:hypothetical protein
MACGWKLSLMHLLRQSALQLSPTATLTNRQYLRREPTPPPPPPPVLDMPGTFNLELAPGHRVALDTLVSADEELDMSRTADGTIVAGNFWGKLEIIHQGDDHRMEFTGTRRDDSLPEDFFFDNRIMNKLAVAAKPTTARCNIYMYSPETQYSDIHLSFSPFWKMGITWPPAEVSVRKQSQVLRAGTSRRCNGVHHHDPSRLIIILRSNVSMLSYTFSHLTHSESQA